MGRPCIVDGIVRGLLCRLANSQWAPGAAMPSTRLLARELGVSPPVIREAYAHLARLGLIQTRPNHPAVVRADAADRAHARLAELAGRRPSRRIAVLESRNRMHPPPGTYWHRVNAAVQTSARAHGIELTYVPWPLADFNQFAERLACGPFGAALVHGIVDASLIVLHRLEELKFPVLMHNMVGHFPGLTAVIRDEAVAIRRIAQTFFDQGHRNLCLIIEQYYQLGSHVQNRVRFWKAALDELGLTDSCPVSVCPLAEGTDRYRHLTSILDAPDGPTAIVLSVAHTRQFLDDPRFRHRRVPQDISIAAFDSTDGVPILPWRPAITSIDLDMHRVGECTMELLEKLLAGDLHPPSLRLVPQIHLTDSLGPPSR
jgi:DNA-binding LacI/PurR family transcriptional regulator